MTGEAWIDTVRLARDFGTVRELFPKWVDDLRDLPYKLFEAIRDGMTFLSFEELLEHERPPKRLYDQPEKLNAWFKEIRRRQRQDRDHAPIDDPVQNEAAKDLIG